MCSSGVGFDPVADGTHYTFDVFGLYEGLFVMADRETGSVWTHFDGSVLKGPLAGTGVALSIVPMAHTTWETWLDLHPDTLVLDWYEEYASRYRKVDPGRGGLSPLFEATVSGADDRLPGNELVFGAGVGEDFGAYVLGDHDGLTVVSDTLGDHPIVVFIDPTTDFALAFSAVVDGETRSFSVVDGAIVDDTGTTWTIEGIAVDGPGAGSELEFVTGFVTEWYGWAAYHPETSIHGR